MKQIGKASRERRQIKGHPRKKPLPLHIEIQIHQAQAAAIRALQSGASMDSVRIDLGRRLFAISKDCGKHLWPRAVRRLGLNNADARSMVKAAKKADRKAKAIACGSVEGSRVLVNAKVSDARRLS